MSGGNKFPSRRKTAKMSNISHTTQNRCSQAYMLACEHGVGDEFMAMVSSGVTINKTVDKLLPDLGNQWRARQRVASFRCATRALMRYGYDVSELVECVHAIAAELQDAPQRTQEADDDN
jgi:hypothetical protein